MKCPKCGSEVKPNYKFCSKCGQPMPAEEQSPATKQVVFKKSKPSDEKPEEEAGKQGPSCPRLSPGGQGKELPGSRAGNAASTHAGQPDGTEKFTIKMQMDARPYWHITDFPIWL